MISTPAATNTGKTQPARRKETAKGAGTLLRDAFDDIALTIGRAALVHSIDDDLTWSLLARIDRIRIRLLQELSRLPSKDLFEPGSVCQPRVHPAVEAFLFRNQPGMGE